MRRGTVLGGRPRRGGMLTGPGPERPAFVLESSQLLAVLMVGLFGLGIVGGFIWSLDRQLRGGVLAQRSEALARPDWIPLERMPDHLVMAFLLVVDQSVRSGDRIPPSARANVPRHLVRQVHLLGDGLPGRARELTMAPLLQQYWSRRDLVEFFLNRVHLGHTGEYPIYGIYHATAEYFRKSARDLSLGEAATLAGLLLEPRIERPGEQPGAVGVRRNEVLRGMLASGLIAEEDYRSAIAEPLGFQPGIAELPMSRRLPSAADTVVIRLPTESPES